jgi:flagellar hook-basal body complex protein FliE
MKISGIPSLSGVRLSPELQKAFGSTAAPKTESPSFGEMLKEKINEVDETQKAADVAIQDVATGKSRNLHEAVLAMEMADTSLRMAVTVRNKVIDAYQEIMRMPV